MKKFLFSIAFSLYAINLLFGQNILKDGGFEEWNGNYLKYWYADVGGGIPYGVTKYNDTGTIGNFSAKIVVQTGTSSSGTLNQSFYYPANNSNLNYKLSFKCKFLSDTENVKLNIKIRRGGYYEEQSYQISSNNIGQWKTYTASFVRGLESIDSSRDIFITLDGYASGNVQTYVVLDDLNIQKVAEMSTEEIKKTDIKIYPNPIKKILLIESQNNIEKSEIFSLTGQLIKTFKGTEIDLSELKKGTYIIKIYSDKEYISQKIIKE